MARRGGLGESGLGKIREEILNPRPARNDALRVRNPLVPPQAPSQAVKPYRRHDVTGEDDAGYKWIIPSATINPPRPRTQLIGYSLSERAVRTIFRDGTTWRYDDVSPQEWERLRRTNSTGRFIKRILDAHDYGPDSFDRPDR